jgi:hypothetical protein
LELVAKPRQLANVTLFQTLELVAKPRQLANVNLNPTLKLARVRLGQTNARKFENQAKKSAYLKRVSLLFTQKQFREPEIAFIFKINIYKKSK